MRLKINALLALFALVWMPGCADGGGGGGKPVETVEASGETITLATPSGKLSEGENKVTVTFTDPGGNPVEVQSPSIRVFMPAMGTMPAKRSEAELQPAGKPGVYSGDLNVEMNGTWQTTIAYTARDRPGGRQKTYTNATASPRWPSSRAG